MTLAVSTLADGVYRLATKMDAGYVADVWGLTTSDGAQVLLGTANGGNNQVFQMVTYNSDYKRFHPLNSGKDLDGWGRVNLTGSEPVCQNEWNGGSNQYWILKHFTGTGGPGEIVYCSNNQSICWDVSEALTANAQPIRLDTAHPGSGVNYGRNQMWDFVKDSFLNRKLPVPAGVGWTDSATGGPAQGALFTATSTAMYVAWHGDAGHYQLRFRTQGRATGSDDWSDYGDWRTLAGLTTDEGWGDAWTYNETPSVSDGICYSSSTISVSIDQETYDRMRVQVEVRKTGNNSAYGLTHGSSSICTLDALYNPTLAISSLTLAVDGLHISYVSDFRRDGNTIKFRGISIGGEEATAKAYTVNGQPYSGEVVIPWSYISTIPADGATATVATTITTADGATRQQSMTATLSYSADYQAVTTSPTITAIDGMEQRVTFPAASVHRSCVIAWKEAGRWVTEECTETDDVFRVIPPLGVAYELRYAATASDNKIWWMTQSMPALESSSLWWTFGDDYAQGRIYDGTVKIPRSRERDYESNLAQGDTYETVAFGVGSKSTISTEIIVPLDDSMLIDHCSKDYIARLETCDYAIFRTPEGDLHHVAITAVSEGRAAKGWRSFDISMRMCEV